MKDQEKLKNLMGESAMIQKQKLDERLRRRKERLEQGNIKLYDAFTFLLCVFQLCSKSLLLPAFLNFLPHTPVLGS